MCTVEAGGEVGDVGWGVGGSGRGRLTAYFPQVPAGGALVVGGRSLGGD